MKNALKVLGFFLLLVLAHQATAQKRELLQSWKDAFKQQFKAYAVDKDTLMAGQLADNIVAMSATEKFKFFRENVVVSDSIKVMTAEVLNFDYGTPQLMTLKKASGKIVMPIAFLRLAKAFNDPGYGDYLLPMYTYKGKADALDYNPDIVTGYDFNGDGTPDEAKYDEATKNVVPFINTPIPQNAPIAGQPGTTAFPNGATGVNQGPVVGYQQTPNGLVPIFGPSATQGGVGGDNAPDTKKARRVEVHEVETEGNQDLFAQADGGQKGGGQNIPEGLFELPRDKDFYYKDNEGNVKLVQKAEDSEPKVVDPGKTGVIMSPDGKTVVRNSTAIEKAEVIRYFDKDGNPTRASEIDAGQRHGVWTSPRSVLSTFGVIPVNGGCNGCNNYQVQRYIDQNGDGCNGCTTVYARDVAFNGYTQGSGGGGNPVPCSGCGW